MGKIIDVTDAIRVESGPARRQTIATKEVLDDRVTAQHYKEGGFDAYGKVIVLGEPMTYLDYRGAPVWYVYKKGPMGIDAKGKLLIPEDRFSYEAWSKLASSPRAKRVETRWVPAGVEDSESAALAVAEGLKED